MIAGSLVLDWCAGLPSKWDINLSRSLLIGDSDRDVDLARVCGVRFLRAAAGRLVEPF